MKVGSKPAILGAVGTAVVCLLGAAVANGQSDSAQRPPVAEDVFKNVRVLRGIPVNQFMATMGVFSASLGVSCNFCHVAESGGNWEKYADDVGRKQIARRMVSMMLAINRDNFGGRQVVTCYSCHRGSNRPKVTPSLAALYGDPPPEELDVIPAQAPGAPSPDQVLDKYIRALGGAQKLASLTSFVARGTYQGYEDPEKHAVEVFAKAPAQRTMIVHTSEGDSTTVYDGRAGWIAGPSGERPVPVLALTGGDLEGVKLDAQLSFPGRVKQALTRWRVGVPATIDDREVQVVQGDGAGGAFATLYFDGESGLLVRLVRYADSPVGRLPTQIDYADYREVSGIKMPFRWKVTWLDGRSTIELSEVRPNAPIDAARFGRPAPPSR
jgi:photosynthetic reaction center cytochrome c subunit